LQLNNFRKKGGEFMDITILKKQFARIGARVNVRPPRFMHQTKFGVDIGHDAYGEFFDLEVPHSLSPTFEALEVRRDLRHLLMMVRLDEETKDKFLCGHDERHWFVAGADDGSTTVESAMRRLRPRGLDDKVERNVRPKDRLRRKNSVFVRQGEWFFLPQPEIVAPESLILRNEPLSRGNGSKPHWCEEVYRHGGTPVYVCYRYAGGISAERYHHLLMTKPDAREWAWTIMRKDAAVFARGKVRHPDHKTIELEGWHQVRMNNENRSGLIFLD
jgi:hypothetical protein